MLENGKNENGTKTIRMKLTDFCDGIDVFSMEVVNISVNEYYEALEKLDSDNYEEYISSMLTLVGFTVNEFRVTNFFDFTIDDVVDRICYLHTVWLTDCLIRDGEVEHLIDENGKEWVQLKDDEEY